MPSDPPSATQARGVHSTVDEGFARAQSGLDICFFARQTGRWRSRAACGTNRSAHNGGIRYEANRSGVSSMKLAGFLLLVAGWWIVVAAVGLLALAGALAGFVLAGIGVEILGLVLVIRSHWRTQRVLHGERG
ncbi:MAG: hypothetical protein ACRD10_13350 [Terriglobia bacterium]